MIAAQISGQRQLYFSLELFEKLLFLILRGFTGSFNELNLLPHGKIIKIVALVTKVVDVVAILDVECLYFLQVFRAALLVEKNPPF